MKFVDLVRIKVKGGRGGNGCISFRREKYVPRGGPDGGNGGKGGDVYLVGDRNLMTLYDYTYKYYYRAGDGEHGRGKNQHGAKGEDIYLRVPLGVVVYDDITGEFLGEILRHGEKLLVARGGRGGRGNTAFKSPTNRAPRYAEKGEEGEERILRIELKLIGDVGIVGFPNSGKTTLLNKLTSARAKIGDYPFTTLSPNLGVYKGSPLEPSFVLVDMPGIIEGASKGKGLGLQFLRHIERARILLLLLDLTQNPKKQYEAILKELGNYKKELLEKPRIIALNKIDLFSVMPEYKFEEETYYISALKGINLDKLKEGIKKCIEKMRI